MIRHLIPVFLLMVSFFYQTESRGQVPANVADYLIERLSGYCEAVPWEDIYVHTDRNKYIAGEDLWFNAYLTNRLQGTPSSVSKIVYVEILNPMNVAVVQERIKIENGSGPGYLYLPDSLSTGIYIIRAYTNWMKNFLPENCFMKEIYIYNALKNKVLKGKPLLPGIDPATNPKRDQLNPSVTLQVDNSRADSLEIIIDIGDNFRYSINNICYLLIHNHGIINRLSQINFRTSMGRIAINKNELPAGVNHITVFNSTAMPVAERFIYVPVPANQNVELRSPDTKGAREKISLEIELSKEMVSSLKSANLSIAVAPFTEDNEASDLADYMIFGSEFGIMPDRIRNGKLSEISPGFIDSALFDFSSKWIDWGKVLSIKKPAFSYGIETENHFISGKLVDQNTQAGDSFKLVILSTPGKLAGFQYATTDLKGRFTFTLPIDGSIKDLIIQPLETNRDAGIKIESTFSEEYPLSGNALKASEPTKPSCIKKWSSNYQVSKIYGSSWLSFPAPVSESGLKQKRFYGKPDIELIMDDYIKLPVMSEVFFELLPGVFLKNRKSVWDISIADPETNIIYDESPVLFVDGVVIDEASKIANLDPELVEKIEIIKDRYLVGDFLFFGIVNVITRAGDFSSVALPPYAVRLPYTITEPVNTFSFPDYSDPAVKQSRIPDFRNTMYWNPSVKPGIDGNATVEFWSSDFSGQYIIDIQGITDNGTRISFKKPIRIR
jgi:hypothetical protein